MIVLYVVEEQLGPNVIHQTRAMASTCVQVDQSNTRKQDFHKVIKATNIRIHSLGKYVIWVVGIARECRWS